MQAAVKLGPDEGLLGSNETRRRKLADAICSLHGDGLAGGAEDPF